MRVFNAEALMLLRLHACDQCCSIPVARVQGFIVYEMWPMLDCIISVGYLHHTREPLLLSSRNIFAWYQSHSCLQPRLRWAALLTQINQKHALLR